MIGVIKRIVSEKGFGFINGPGNIEYFFHRTAVRDVSMDDLREGQKVRFEEEKSAKGPRAGSVYQL